MARCDLCGRPSNRGQRHPACLRRIFGRPREPTLPFGMEMLSSYALAAAGRLSISGVQPKLSAALRRGRLEPVVEGGRFIIKPQTPTFPHLPENEHLCMTMAAAAGIEVAPHILLPLSDGSLAYVVQRFDRLDNGSKVHCEDFAQILGSDKYRGSIERIGKVLRLEARFPGLAVQQLLEQVCFFFLIGNGDSHLKNFSLLYANHGPQLAPAYDIVSSKLVIPAEQDMALTVCGRRDKLRRRDFEQLGAALNIPQRVVAGIIDRLCAACPVLDELREQSALPKEQAARLAEIMAERATRLRG